MTAFLSDLVNGVLTKMSIFTKGKVQELVQRYEAAANLEYNLMANTQVKAIHELCKIGTKDAIDCVAEFMVIGNNHDYMDFAIPDILALYLDRPASEGFILSALITGMLKGQNEVIRNACISKLVEMRYTHIYRTLIDYRNFLLLDKQNRPDYWQVVLNAVIEAVSDLNPYVDASIRISGDALRLNQPV
jgi:hypothetical protein